MGLDDRERGIVVRAEARAVMAAYRPVVWLVLQDVALEAEWSDGRLVAATSARLVAEHLQVDPGTAAAALRVLREAGLVQLGQTTGPDGRFGLASYTLLLPDGVVTLTPEPTEPRTETPCAVNAHADVRDVGLVLSCPPNGEPPSTAEGSSSSVPPWSTPTVGGPATPAAPSAEVPRRRRAAANPSVEQGAFDLGTDL